MEEKKVFNDEKIDFENETCDINNQDRDSEIVEFKEALDEINNEFSKEENMEDESENIIDNENLNEDIFDENEDVDDDFTNENAEDANETYKVNAEETNDAEVNFKDFIEENDVSADKNGVNKEYSEYRMKKMFALIHYNLAFPELDTQELKKRIADGVNYDFKSYSVLSTKVKSLKKEIKDGLKICSVIGYNSGEISSEARRVEIAQSKRAKVKEIAVFMPLTTIKENNQKLTVKEYTRYKKLCGANIAFKVIIDCSKLNVIELNFAVTCAVLSKADGIVLYNYEKAPVIYALRTAKICENKCLVEVTLEGGNSAKLNELMSKGADNFLIEKAVATAETIKHQEI